MRTGSIPKKQGLYPRVKGVFGGYYKHKIFIINDLKIYISWFSRPIKRTVEVV